MPAVLPDLARWRDHADGADGRDSAIWRAGAASRALALTREGTPRQRLTKDEGIPADDRARQGAAR